MAGEKILIVDDNINLQKVLDMLLRANGYSVVHATDADSAIRVAQRERPNGIILDIALPGGDGFAVMDRLKFLSSITGTPIIMLTANATPTSKERALKAGAVAFLQKPIDNNRLLATLRKAIGESAKIGQPRDFLYRN